MIIFNQFILYMLKTLKYGGIGCNEPSHSDKCIHDFYTYVGSFITA